MIVRGGTIVTPTGIVSADLAVEDGAIAAIGPELPGGTEEIDARGLTVLPGLIDIHVHFNEPGRDDWEGAATGSRALAAGGGTLFFDMPLNSSPCTVGPLEFDAKRTALERSSMTDFGLWGGIVPGNRDALAELAARGAVGFKAFMAESGLPEFPRADDLTLFEGMCEAARLGLPVAVHAESNEMVHVTDMFTTLLKFTGCEPPHDRLIDGVDQSPFFLGQQKTSNRESCMVWLKDELHAVKWKDFKINFKRQQHFHDPELPLGFARITHLQEDPKEREPVNQRYVRWWVMQHANRIVREFEQSTKSEELIPPGSPVDFVPKTVTAS